MAKRYVIAGIDSTSRPILQSNLHHALAVAKVMEQEFGGEPLSGHTIYGMIRLIADQQGFGQYVNVDEVFNALVESEFLEAHDGQTTDREINL